MSQSQYQTLADQYANQYGIPPAIFEAQIANESNWSQSAISPKGAIGLGQLEPGTAQMLGVNPYIASSNLQGAAMYDAKLYKQFGNWYDALQAYNGGPGNVGSQQTQQYASSILSKAGVNNFASDTLPGGGTDQGAINALNQPQAQAQQSLNNQGIVTDTETAAQFAGSNCKSVIPGYCAIADFFTTLSSAVLWEDIAAVVLGLLLIGGAFVAMKSGVSVNPIK